MGRRIVAFAPGHISGYFQKVDGETLEKTGSIGAGVVIDHGVTVTMTESDFMSVVVNDCATDDGWLIREVLRELGVVAATRVHAAMPIGAGFGMSAAGLLATYHAANRLFGLGFGDDELAEKAHEFEVRHSTGLGDVAAAASGGIVVRTSAGIHGVEARIFSDETIYAVSFGSIPTPDIITSKEKMQQVKDAFPQALPKSLEDVMKNSNEFAKNSGLMTPRVKEILTSCDEFGVLASMTMLGDGVFAYGELAKDVLSKFGDVYCLKVSKTGPIILEDSNV